VKRVGSRLAGTASQAFSGMLALLLAGAIESAGAASPEANYMIHCMGCHLSAGEGFPPAVPDARGEIGMMLKVEGGREYLVQVPGAAHAPLTDQELAEVVNYMLLNFSKETLPKDFEPLTGEEVARYRKVALIEVEEARAELLARIETLEHVDKGQNRRSP